MEKKEKDENEYLNWYWHPASRRWRWHNPLHRSGRDKKAEVKLQSQKQSLKLIGSLVKGSSAMAPLRDNQEAEYTREELIRDLQGAFCKGRYRSWVARKRR